MNKKELHNWLDENIIHYDKDRHFGDIYEKLNDAVSDFEIADYRFINKSQIDEILRDEMSSDTYVLGSFCPWFIAENTNLSIEIVEALQKSDKYDVIGKHIIDNDYLEDLSDAYVEADGYGHHFGLYDGNELFLEYKKDLSYYVFRIN